MDFKTDPVGTHDSEIRRALALLGRERLQNEMRYMAPRCQRAAADVLRSWAAEDATSKDARDEAMLLSQRENNKTARSAKNAAWAAAMAAAIANIIAIVAVVMSYRALND